jgi:CRP-like cAMP-binding protein
MSQQHSVPAALHRFREAQASARLAPVPRREVATRPDTANGVAVARLAHVSRASSSAAPLAGGASSGASSPAERLDGEGGDGGPVYANHLLQLLARESSAEYDALLSLLEPVTHAHGEVLHEPGQPIPYAYFPTTSVCSIIRVMTTGRRVEVGTTGFDGMVGLPLFLGADTTPFLCVAQIPGAGWGLPVAAFREAAGQRALHRIMQRFAQYLYDQAAQSVACNRLHGVHGRCARWLLMTHDRVRLAKRFPLTHAYLAFMLGVRRASVSVAAEALQRAGHIRYSRGSIAVLDRDGLKAASCECYETDRADFHRLLG